MTARAASATPLVRRSQRRLSWVGGGLLLILVGGWLMWGAVQAARLRLLICERAAAGAACQGQLIWLGAVLRETPLTIERAAVESDPQQGHRLVLVSDGHPLPFSDFAAEASPLQADADRINAFLAAPTDEKLVVRSGGAFEQLPIGLIGSIIAAVGFFFTVAGYRVVTRPAHANTVARLAFSPQGRLLASASWDKTVHLWQVAPARLARTLAGHTGPVVDLAFTPDGQQLVTVSWDQTIRLWRLAEGTVQRAWRGAEEAIASLALSPAGEIIATGAWDRLIRLWRLEDGALLRTFSGHQGTVESLAFTPDGQTLVSGSADGTVRLWQVSDGACSQPLNHPETVTCVACAPDGRAIATGSTDGRIRRWAFPAGHLEYTIEGSDAWMRDLAFSPDGRWLVSASTDGRVRLWRAEDGALEQTLSGHTGEVICVAVAPGGNLVASGSADQMVRLWQIF